jgi:hypothetical protein
MSDSEVERVARAIYRQSIIDDGGPDPSDTDSNPWGLCVAQARAAIAAMREPTVYLIEPPTRAMAECWRPGVGQAQTLTGIPTSPQPAPFIPGLAQQAADYAAYRAMHEAMREQIDAARDRHPGTFAPNDVVNKVGDPPELRINEDGSCDLVPVHKPNKWETSLQLTKPFPARALRRGSGVFLG